MVAEETPERTVRRVRVRASEQVVPVTEVAFRNELRRPVTGCEDRERAPKRFSSARDRGIEATRRRRRCSLNHELVTSYESETRERCEHLSRRAARLVPRISRREPIIHVRDPSRQHYLSRYTETHAPHRLNVDDPVATLPRLAVDSSASSPRSWPGDRALRTSTNRPPPRHHRARMSRT